MKYTDEIREDDDVFTVEEFRRDCESCLLIDYDGFGYPARGGKMSKQRIYPSAPEDIPGDATHIVWFNR